MKVSWLDKKLENNIIKERLKREIDDITIKDIRSLFRLKEENEAIKERVVRNIRNFFEYEEDYYKLIRLGNFWSNNILNMKVMVIEVKHYQLENILIKLEQT